MKKIAVVTGGNKGIGFEVCKQLAEKGFHVMLTSRNSSKGKKAAKELQSNNLDVEYFKLDVTNKNDISKLAEFVKSKYKRLDVLVSNAGVDLETKTDVTKTESNVSQKIFDTNVFGPLFLSQALYPLMKKGSRIVNVSSRSGQISGRMGLQSKMRSPIHVVSNFALNGLTVKLSHNSKGVLVNSASPGWVRTDMGGRIAPRSVTKGAETIVWLATAEKIPNGKFVHDKKVIDW